MASFRDLELWRQLRAPAPALLLAAIALAFIRARDQPSVGVAFGSTTASITPQDVLLVLLAGVALARLGRRRPERALWPVAATGLALCLLIVGSAIPNGSTAFVSGAKLVELAALTLGVIAIVRTRAQIEAIVDVLLLFTIAADVVGVVVFLADGGGRQSAFLGEHDFAALSTLPLVYGLALLFEPRPRIGRGLVAAGAGSLGCILGAALASLAGFYLAVLVLLLVGLLRHRLTRLGVVTALVAVGLVTGGTLTLRANDLGFLQALAGTKPSRPGQFASSWSQRLIYAYVGGRIFLAHPLLGTGWYGDPPPSTFASFIPAARRRFSDQPPRYFPPTTTPFIPQMWWDEVLYELGIVGGVAMLAVLVALAGACRRAASAAADWTGLLPATWLAATIGALAGEGLFGGTPLAATFWVVAGVIAVSPLLSEGAP